MPMMVSPTSAPITTTPLAASTSSETKTTKKQKQIVTPPPPPPPRHDVINIDQILTSPLPTLEQHRTMIEKKQQATSPDFLYGSFAGN